STHSLRKSAPPRKSSSSRFDSSAGLPETGCRAGPTRRHVLGLVPAAIALSVDGSGRAGLADRVRQCSQPAAGARGGATERDRRASGAGRETFPPYAATAHRKRAAGGGGRSAGFALRALGERPVAEAAVFKAGDVVFSDRVEWARASVYVRGFGVDRLVVRVGAGVARDAR